MQTLAVQNTTNVTKENLEGIKNKVNSKIIVHCKKECNESDSEQAEENGLSHMTHGSLAKINSVPTEETMGSTVVARNGVKSNDISTLRRIPVSLGSRNTTVSNGPILFKSFRGSATIGNGPIRVVSSLGGSSLNRSMSTSGTQSQNSKDEACFKSPASVPVNEVRKKMIITTVPKKVPLINTVGNQSKLIPMTLPPQSQTPVSSSTETNSVSPTWTNSQAKNTTKSLSILHARLTSPTSGVALQPVKEISKPSSDSLSSPKMPVSPQAGTNSEAVLKQRTYLTASETVSLKKAVKKLKPILNFEKGLTRLVAVESRTVTMVDVSTQVFIPEAQGQEDADLMSQTTPLQAVSSDNSGSAASPAVPLSQKQFVVVDTKNGKKVLAIPKQILRNYSGPKTFVIEGKTVKARADGSLEYLPNFSNGVLESAKLKQNSADPTVNIRGTLTIVPNSHLSRRTVEVAGASASKPAFKPSESQHIASVSDKMLPVQWSTTLSNTPISDSCPTSVAQSISSDADTLILPLNSPIKNTSSSSSEGTSLHTLPNSSSLVFVVPNSKDSKKSELHDAHDSLIKSGVGIKRKDNISHSQSPPLKKMCLETIKSDSGVPPLIPKKDDVNVNKGRVIRPQMDAKEIKVVHNSSESGQDHANAVNGQSPSGTMWNVSDTFVNSNINGALNVSSREEVDKFVKSTFTEFKNCLSVNAEGKLPIHTAVENNDITAVARQCILLKARRASVNLANAKDESPLQLALNYGHSPIVKVLLQHGADATVIDHEGNTTLHLAVSYAEEALESLLLSRQLSKKLINCINDDGFSALHLAAQHDKVKAINQLVIHGAQVDLPDGRSGRTALFHAVDRKNYNAQKTLIDCGADMKEPTFTGTTPFLVTRSDAIAQLASGHDTILEEVDADTLLKPSKRSRVGKIR